MKYPELGGSYFAVSPDGTGLVIGSFHSDSALFLWSTDSRENKVRLQKINLEGLQKPSAVLPVLRQNHHHAAELSSLSSSSASSSWLVSGVDPTNGTLQVLMVSHAPMEGRENLWSMHRACFNVTVNAGLSTSVRLYATAATAATAATTATIHESEYSQKQSRSVFIATVHDVMVPRQFHVVAFSSEDTAPWTHTIIQVATPEEQLSDRPATSISPKDDLVGPPFYMCPTTCHVSVSSIALVVPSPGDGDKTDRDHPSMTFAVRHSNLQGLDLVRVFHFPLSR